jgi:hypothetical protein
MEPKYIGVRNWAKYQGRIGKKGEVRRDWIKTSTSLDSDANFSDLSPTERYILEGCRRLIGLHGQNPPNDRLTILRQLSVKGLHKVSASVAIGKLLGCGLLFLTNHKDPFSDLRNGTELNNTETQVGSNTQEDTDQNLPYPEITGTILVTDEEEDSAAATGSGR